MGPWDPYVPATQDEEHYQPLFFGNTPRELATGAAPKPSPEIPAPLKDTGSIQADEIRKQLHLGSVQLEAWPVEEDGVFTWAYARWRTDSRDPWKWLDPTQLKNLNKSLKAKGVPEAVLPDPVHLAHKQDYFDTFTPGMKMAGLYDKPSFPNVLWLSKDGQSAYAGWLPTVERDANAKAFEADRALLKNLSAVILPQPPRFNAEAITFTVEARSGKVAFPKGIRWVKPIEAPKISAAIEPHAFVPDFEKKFERDLKIFAGDQEAVFPQSGRRMKFLRKSSGDPQTQLNDLVDYLEERHHSLGFATERVRIEWEGIPQSNLIVKIRGSLPDSERKVYVLADHIDTAFAEDTFDKTGERVAVPGADDNGTAVATILRAAEELRGSQPKHDIWFMHIAGEEFPAVDFGARELMTKLLKERVNIGAFILLDMAGFNPNHGKLFQLNPSMGENAVRVAALAQKAAAAVAPDLQPALRLRFDPKGYLYNTDGLTFERAGYDVVLFNEEMNRFKLFRKGYHDTGDIVAHVDIHYACGIAKTAIQTIIELANP